MNEDYDCMSCLDGTVTNDTCDACDERHCPECDPCDEEDIEP